MVWTNADSGSIYMAQPHGGANASSGPAAQGYLVATEKHLLVPTGRAVPAVFDRASGKFLYFHLQANGRRGGSRVVAGGPGFVNGGMSFNAADGKPLVAVAYKAIAATPDGFITATGKELHRHRWVEKKTFDRKGDKVKVWTLVRALAVPGLTQATSLVVAGNIAFLGGEDSVCAVDLDKQKVAWTAPVKGAAVNLAVSDGRLLVSTERGHIYAFGKPDGVEPITVRPTSTKSPYGENAEAARAAKEILDKAGLSEGYCIDLGCGDGRLALELARQSKLHIIAIDDDAAMVEQARRKLDAAGLYGARVSVFHGDPRKTSFPRYVANLVVPGRAVADDGKGRGEGSTFLDEVRRLQRPFGGVACIGKPGAMRAEVRGPLEGSGNWTHQYANPANTGNSDDDLVKGPLGMLWFRDADFAMPQRHGRGPAPLYLEGRLFVQGLNGIRAADAYNGRTLWEYSLPGILKAYDGDHLMGTSGTGSNYCVSKDGVFVRLDNRCLRLDPATGKKLGEFEAVPRPDGKPGRWGFLAQDGDLLFGSQVNDRHIVKYTWRKEDMSQLFTESLTLFALDSKTGKPKWTYTAKHSLRHNAIAIGGGRVYLIDRPLAKKDRLTATAQEKKDAHPPGELIALDAQTGKVLWRSKDVYGTMLSLSTAHDTLLMAYQPTRFKLSSEVGGRLAGFRASDGKSLWDQKGTYQTRPFINGRTVFAQGGAWDLVTGEPEPFPFKRSYGCGQLSASRHLMLFRSATLGFYSLEQPSLAEKAAEKKTQDYGGLRPGCWINAIPAGGIVLVPDAAAGCSCSYLNSAWVGLHGRE